MTDELTIPIPSGDPNVSVIHEYVALGRVKSRCKVEIWNLGDEKAVVLFTEIDFGTSVTNSAETLVKEIYNKYLNEIDKDKCIFMETYSERLDDIDLITPTWRGDEVTSVSWRHLGKRITPEVVKDEYE